MFEDVYQPCPFCKTTKLKFCCAVIADDMERVIRLQESRQTLAALNLLEQIKKKHPDKLWNEFTRASILLEEGQPEEALGILNHILQQKPEHTSVIALHAIATYAVHGYRGAKDSIVRAFHRAAEDEAELVSNLSLSIAMEFFGMRCYLACRQHLVLALRFAPTEYKQECFVKLLEFDGNSELPYPLRGAHNLIEPVTGLDEEATKLAHKAYVLSSFGAYAKAAERYDQLLENAPENSQLLYNAALCRAWIGDEEIAVKQLHDAADHIEDFEKGAEYEALAQLLELNVTEDVVPIRSQRFTTSSSTLLISACDEQPRFSRVPMRPEEAEGGPVAMFEILDRQAMSNDVGDDLKLDEIPNVIAQLSIYDFPAEAGGPQVALTGLSSDMFETAKEVVTEAELSIEPEGEPEDAQDGWPRDWDCLNWRWAYPEKFPIRRRRELELSKWNQVIDEKWKSSPLSVLGGKSPQEAVGDESLQTRLAGALYVLDAFCDRSRYEIDLNKLRTDLGLPEVGPLSPEGVSLNSLSNVALHRVPVAEADVKQLRLILNRALLIHERRYLYATLREVLERTPEETDLNRVYQTLSELARDRANVDEALEWIAKGKEYAQALSNSFEEVFRWDTRELSLRLEDPTSEDVKPCINRLREYYGPKLPQFEEHLNSVLAAYGVTAAHDLSIDGTGSGTGGVWTPEAASQAPAGGKLWVPGQ
ncbi:tetratricopeptide repeat protein [Calycomorphotria hydatis]|uniref:Uncharacterized protein n=1 Tax=Calycomorphotria hydatis TaxID=2528027 RepID=A0A517TCC0_9PLAN|nr:hypothetical protein [Calycomorphotria hydatis]QDT66019.1 hypothetical protein V22_32830 [Calycomorphotria hydatis]